MALFSDDKFVFPCGESDRFYRASAIEIHGGSEIETWVYKSGSRDEWVARRSLNGFDKEVCRVAIDPISREDYNFYSLRTHSPLIFKFGRNVA